MITKYKIFLEELKSEEFWNIIPKSIKDIHEIFRRNDKKLYIVGGAIRDFLNSETPDDFDLSTDALPDEIIDMLNDFVDRGLYKINLQGKKFGVVVVYTKDQPKGVEIATFREDLSKGRNPEVKLGVTIKDDVKRRDLTYNSLFFDMSQKKIIDIVGGVKDMQDKVTRMVGDPVERIDEDPLRILRIFRFSSRYKAPLSKDLKNALKKRNNLDYLDENGEIVRISSERIWAEIKKAYDQSLSFKYYLDFFNEFNMWEEVFPGSKINTNILECDEFTSYIANLFKFEETRNLERKLVQEYKIEIEIASKIVFLIDLLKLTPENAFDLYKKKIRCHVSNSQIIDWLDTCEISDKIFIAFIDYKPSVSSEELMNKGFKGRELGNEIKRLEIENFKKLIYK
jgi:tRNA nucleotidyltransferase/poly(A) polymerase